MSIECFATQSGASYGGELTRRAMFAGFARTAANTPGILAGGLVSSTDLQLSAPASGMSVNVSTGEAIVGGTSGTTQGGYYFRNTAQANISVAAANPSNPRIDAVVATVADAGYAQPSDVGGTTNGGVLAVVTGTPTTGATLTNLSGAPAIPLSSLLLGYVLVPANSTSVTSGNISNIARVLAFRNGGWQNLILASGITSPGGAGDFTPQARLEGDRVWLRGVIQNTSGSSIAANTAIFTVPAGTLPASNATFGATDATGGSAVGAVLVVLTSGTAILSSAGPGLSINGEIPLNALSYSLF